MDYIFKSCFITVVLFLRMKSLNGSCCYHHVTNIAVLTHI